MRFLYILGVLIYGIAIRLASLFSPKAKSWIAGRKNFWDNIPPISNDHVVWFHCASLGEFDQGLPLMTKIKTKHPEVYLLVTFFSPSGYKHFHKREHLADFVCYLPLDTPSNAKKFVHHFKPRSIFFVKYEFWGNLIEESFKSNARLYNLSGLFRENHRFFAWYGGYFRKMLHSFTHFFVQDEGSIHLLSSIGIDQASIIGDTRFDRVIEHKVKVQPNQIIEDFRLGEDLFVLGSSWPEDEKIVFPWINSSSQKILIAPHSIDEKRIQEIESACLRKTIRYTQWEENSDAEVLILDTIGHLAGAYQSGYIAYIGGGFSGSLHNILEPAVFGLPVVFGPKHTRFPEANQFIQGGFGFSVKSTGEFENALAHIEQNIEAIRQKEQMFIQKNSGATQKVMDFFTASSIV